jgi:transketolase
MGAAPMAYVLWTRFLRHNPASPHWFNRDRFVLPAGVGEHGSTHQPIELIRVMRGFGPEVRDFGPPGWIDFRTGHSCREKHRCR